MTSKVKFLISKTPVTAEKGTKLEDVVKIMASMNIGSVIITDKEKPVGIITERDIIRALAKGIPLTEKIENVGTMDLITVFEDDSIYTAAEKMNKYNIRHLVVIDKEGNFKGVISIRDLIRESYVLKALANVSQEEWLGSD
ncbi:CBS domain-containing protein [Acidianus hospitalis]|jgi:CBS domain-containing protein|uniref:CBS domain-containing protein n=2 Tax=Acidianus hospitalis TaxID=563177 RepID=A0A2T9XCL8_9CREN|nr:CBS domain-containing protein [Acidianus hospitalis]AEE93194.1 putative signal-transduction protein with CBS domains [Acidianus hospitalis W1]PVU77844.1 CBS domain-containing protein [Acidianus hospitalis]